MNSSPTTLTATKNGSNNNGNIDTLAYHFLNVAGVDYNFGGAAGGGNTNPTPDIDDDPNPNSHSCMMSGIDRSFHDPLFTNDEDDLVDANNDNNSYFLHNHHRQQHHHHHHQRLLSTMTQTTLTPCCPPAFVSGNSSSGKSSSGWGGQYHLPGHAAFTESTSLIHHQTHAGEITTGAGGNNNNFRSGLLMNNYNNNNANNTNNNIDSLVISYLNSPNDFLNAVALAVSISSTDSAAATAQMAPHPTTVVARHLQNNVMLLSSSSFDGVKMEPFTEDSSKSNGAAMPISTLTRSKKSPESNSPPPPNLTILPSSGGSYYATPPSFSTTTSNKKRLKIINCPSTNFNNEYSSIITTTTSPPYAASSSSVLIIPSSDETRRSSLTPFLGQMDAASPYPLPSWVSSNDNPEAASIHHRKSSSPPPLPSYFYEGGGFELNPNVHVIPPNSMMTTRDGINYVSGPVTSSSSPSPSKTSVIRNNNTTFNNFAAQEEYYSSDRPRISALSHKIRPNDDDNNNTDYRCSKSEQHQQFNQRKKAGTPISIGNNKMGFSNTTSPTSSTSPPPPPTTSFLLMSSHRKHPPYPTPSSGCSSNKTTTFGTNNSQTADTPLQKVLPPSRCDSPYAAAATTPPSGFTITDSAGHAPSSFFPLFPHKLYYKKSSPQTSSATSQDSDTTPTPIIDDDNNKNAIHLHHTPPPPPSPMISPPPPFESRSFTATTHHRAAHSFFPSSIDPNSALASSPSFNNQETARFINVLHQAIPATAEISYHSSSQTSESPLISSFGSAAGNNMNNLMPSSSSTNTNTSWQMGSASVAGSTTNPSPTNYPPYHPLSNSKHLCAICGDKASGKHYGVYSCEGCKGFFKRTVRKELSYACRENQSCVIDKRQRNRCQFCRYQKCLTMGMKREAVQEERKKSDNSEIEPTSSSVSHEMPIDQILEAELRVDTCAENTFVDSQKDAVTNICQAADKQLFCLVEWAKCIPHFIELPIEDQVKLLRIGWNELLIASFSHRSIPIKDGILLSSGLHIHRSAAHQAGVGAIFDRVLTELVAKMREMKINRTELGCLRAIILFNPDAKNLKNVAQVEQLREKVYATLEEYCKQNYPDEPGRFAKLLLRLPSLRSIGLKCLEHLFFFKLIGDTPIDTFLTQLLEAPSLFPNTPSPNSGHISNN